MSACICGRNVRQPTTNNIALNVFVCFFMLIFMGREITKTSPRMSRKLDALMDLNAWAAVPVIVKSWHLPLPHP